jgi:cyclase
LELITKLGEQFGSQAVIASIDTRPDGDGRYAVYSDCGRRREDPQLLEHVDAVVGAGAGEILLQSIDRDGMMSGYDVELIRSVVQRSPIPVIGCGGAGTYEHMRQAFVEANAQALACGSLFNFGDNNPIRAKAFLTNHGLAFKLV